MRWRYLPDGIHGMGEWNYRDQGYIDTLNAYHLSRQKELLYTAPPAPVSVPDAMTPKQASRAYCGEVRGYRDGWNACRAVMLQGADGNSPVIPDGWVACSELMPEQFKAILAFNEYGEVWSGAYDRYWNFYCDNLLVEHVTHWMPLPAAPQQEVK